LKKQNPKIEETYARKSNLSKLISTNEKAVKLAIRNKEINKMSFHL